MQAERAGEHAVAERDLHNVVARCAGGHDDARHAVRPHIQIVRRVTHDRGLAGGAGGRVDADDLLHGLGEQTEGVIVAQIGLGGGRDAADIVKRFDAVRRDAGLIQLFGVERHVAVAIIHRPFQPLQLQLFELFARHGFNVFLEKHLCKPPIKSQVVIH